MQVDSLLGSAGRGSTAPHGGATSRGSTTVPHHRHVGLPNVMVQVIAHAIGEYLAVESNFNILQLPEPAPNVISVKRLAEPIYHEQPRFSAT
jgi:hypothetical protein